MKSSPTGDVSLYESYMKAAFPAKPVEKVDEKLVGKNSKVLKQTDKWRSAGDRSTMSLMKVRAALANMVLEINKVQTELGDAQEPGFSMAIGKDLVAFAKTLHPQV